MFYSQTFLARKGPLGTVWCAAHLQHRLKKSHYTATDILSTVDFIMYPEVPIALRMSGHLLLGVVRIYSKKVEYLFQDCNVVLTGLRKAFACIEVDLPVDARQAPFQSVTLPETFDLDALDLDYVLYDEGAQDDHLKTLEEITLPDQIPVGRDPYIAISFDEDITMELSRGVDIPDSGVKPMEEDLVAPDLDGDVGFRDPSTMDQTEVLNSTLPAVNSNLDTQDPRPSNQTEELNVTSLPEDINFGIRDSGPSNQTEVLNRDSSPSFLEIEVMRDASHAFSSEHIPLVSPCRADDMTEPNISLDQTMKEKESLSPMIEDMPLSGEKSLPLQQLPEHTASAASDATPENTHVSFGLISPELAIRSSPCVQQSQPVQQQPQPVKRPRPRRRKRPIIDETLVFSNKFMKEALKDCKDLSRKRSKTHISSLGLWKLNNILRKEQVFDGSLVTGLCADLCNIAKKDFLATKPHLAGEPIPEPDHIDSPVPTNEGFPESRIVQSPVARNEAFPEHRVANSPAPTIEAFPEPRVAQSPLTSQGFLEPRFSQSPPTVEAFMEPRVAESPASMPEVDIEIERLRHNQGPVGSNMLSEFMPSPARFVSSPRRHGDECSPLTANTVNLGSESQVGTNFGSGILPTPDLAASTGSYGSELEAPKTFSQERLGFGNSGLSDIQELYSAEAGDLYFLEADNNSPAGSQGNQEVDTMSVRTRAVAQYLKTHSPISSVSEEVHSEDLSLNKILEGKTRKLCSRMFFETLVLKTYGLIDVHQEEPYGDITLTLTPMLSKAQI